MKVIRAEDREPFVTRDGSTVREIAGPPSLTASNQSLAEATVAPGGETIEHYHRTSEEVYRFLSGVGRMRLGDDESEVRERLASDEGEALEVRQSTLADADKAKLQVSVKAEDAAGNSSSEKTKATLK